MARGAQSRLPAGEQDLSPEDTALLADMQQDDGAGLPEPAPPPAAAEPAPEPAAEAPVAPERPRQDTVPHAALHEEREARKRAEADLATERARIQMLEERTNLILQRFQPQTPVPEKPVETPIPDVNTDPVGFIVGTQRAQQERLDAMQRERDQRSQIDQTAQIVGAIQQRATAMEQAYLREKPDYPQAVSMLMGQRHRELEAVGYRDPAQRQLMIQQEGLQLAAMALQNGRNPAEVLYELANQRGYAAPASAAGANGNGAAAPAAPEPAPAASAVPAAADRIDQIARGQQQSRGIGNARGAAPAALTAQRLLEMNEREFAQMLETQEGMDLLGA